MFLFFIASPSKWEAFIDLFSFSRKITLTTLSRVSLFLSFCYFLFLYFLHELFAHRIELFFLSEINLFKFKKKFTLSKKNSPNELIKVDWIKIFALKYSRPWDTIAFNQRSRQYLWISRECLCLKMYKKVSINIIFEQNE